MPNQRIVFTATLGELAEVPGTSFAYWAPKSLRDLFQKFPPLDRDVARQPDKPKVADVKQGLDTAHDAQFTRFWWEVPVGQIATSREETFQGKKWVPFARGSWLNKFFADISVLVNWEKDGEEIKNFRNADGRLFSRPQNTSFYFRKGLTWVRSPQAGTVMKQGIQLNVRFFPHGCIFTGDACAVFPAGTEFWGLLAILNSKLALVFMRLVGAERKVQVGHLASLPVAFAILKDVGLVTSACEAYNLLREWDRGNEVNTQHIKPWLLQVWEAVRGARDELTAKSMTGHPLASAFAWSDWESTKRIRMLTPNKAEPDGINLQVLAEACVERERLLRQRMEEIQRQIDDEVYRLYGISDEDRALIEAELRRVPEQEDAEEAGAEEPEEEALPEGITPAEEHIRRLVHYLAHQVVREDADGIVSLHDIYTADGRLERGLAYKVRERLQNLFGESMIAGVESDLRQALGRPLEQWLETEFFSYHVGLYRLRPIIWQLASQPRGRPAFSCFLDWHRLDADTLRKVQEVYLRPTVDSARREAARLAAVYAEQRARDAPLRTLRTAERTWQQVQGRAQELETLSEKIARLFQPHRLSVQSRSTWVLEKVNEIVSQGYRPDRDYGVRVNIEPLKQAEVLAEAARRIKG